MKPWTIHWIIINWTSLLNWADLRKAEFERNEMDEMMVQYLYNVSMCLWWCRLPLTPEAQAAQISVVTLQKTVWFSCQLIQMSPSWRYFSTYCSFSISGDNTLQETVYSPCRSKWAFSDLSAPKKNVQSTKSSTVNKMSNFENHESYNSFSMIDVYLHSRRRASVLREKSIHLCEESCTCSSF